MRYDILIPPDRRYATGQLDPERRLTPVFLAGPIQGAENWQSIAAAELANHAIVFSPRTHLGLTTHKYAQQIAWETEHLSLTYRHGGIILFWLAKESEKIEGRAYAQTSRFELGEWFGRVESMGGYANSGAAVLVGIEPGFSGERYIRERMRAVGWPEPIDSFGDWMDCATRTIRYGRKPR